jgi:hypothetical protein
VCQPYRGGERIAEGGNGVHAMPCSVIAGRAGALQQWYVVKTSFTRRNPRYDGTFSRAERGVRGPAAGDGSVARRLLAGIDKQH